MSVDRSELVKHQLRDKHGRWIKMGFKVKWGGDSGDSFHGTVVGIHDGTATVRLYDKYGQDLHKNATVSGDKLEVINAKAILHLDANGHAIADPHPAHVPEVAPSEHKIGSTLPDKYKITGGHLYTKVNDLKVGQQVYPISHAGSEKSIYNTKQSYSDIGVLKNASGLGTVSKIKPNAYAEITPAGGGDPIYISKNHYVSVRTPELDDAILHAQQVEAQSIYNGKEAPKLPWIDKLKDAQVPAHDGTHVNGTTPGTAVEHAPAEPAAPSVPAVQENPFGAGYKALGFVPAQMKKGDKALFNDGKTGDYVGKGHYQVGEHTLTGLKFNIDGKNVVVPGKNIKDIYRPDSHIIVTKTSGSPFGTEYKPISFDMGKANTENFKPGDKITYGDSNHPGTIVQIHEHDIIVNKDDSQTHNYTPWIHLKPSQVKSLYRKQDDNTSATPTKLDSVSPAVELTPTQDQKIADSNANKIASFVEGVDFTVHTDGTAFWEKDGNPLVAAALEHMGIAKNKPIKVSDEEFSQLKNDGHHVIYRGISGVVEGTTAQQAQQDILSSDSPKIGNGLYGGGTYFTNNPDEAKSYGHSGGAVSTFALTPDAKMVTMDDITKIRDDIKSELGDKLTPKVSAALKDVGFVAAMTGFDGIFIPGGNGNVNGASNFYTMLNRGTMAYKENNIVPSADFKFTIADMPWGNKKETAFGKAVPTGKPAPKNPENVPEAPATQHAPAPITNEPKPFAPAPTQEHTPADENLKSMMDQINGTESKPSSSAAVEVYPDKGKSVTNESGQVIKVNSEVFTPKFGKGIVAIVLPSSDPSKLGSAKVNYHEHGYKVTQAKNLSLVTEDLKQAEPVSTDHLNPGDTGLNPANGKNFIAGKDSQPIHVGDKVSYTKGSKTNTGTVKGIYAGEKTVSIKWDDGTVSGPKKASTLTAVNKPDTNHTDVPSASEAPAETPVEQMPEKYSKEDEEALLAFSTNAKEIGEHLRGIAAHAFPNAEGIIYGLDNLLKNSSLSEPTTVYRGFKINSANHGNGKSVFDSVKVGSIWRDKSFTSTSLSADIANQSLNEMDGDHSVLLTFELPAGYHATQINYNGFSDKSMAAKAHEQEVILPRAMEYEISHVEDTVDANGNPIRKATLKGVIKDTADGLTSPGVHQVTSDEKVSEHPYQMLKDPGADGDGFHPSGPWGHFGASGVMVQAIDPNTHEPVYLIVENGALHEEQNQGLWQLPGGALNGNENPYEGAAREMWEELDVPPDTMAALNHVGNIQYSNGKGWAYNNLAAKHNGAPFDVKIDVIETSDHKWATKEELLQMKAEGKLLPAFAQNIENVLNLYPEEPKQESGHLSLSDFTKVQGKGQQGSNAGGFYTNKATGEEYYIKSGMSEDHAHNEILASKIYQAMGINASNQEPIDLGHGKLGIASKIIATDGHSSNQNLHNPEYLKKVQEGFAVDALLANWDVAGMGYDNILTDAHGNPLRIDPGASLKYRAQGALKSDFGKSVGEWNYLRDGSNNESSGLKYNKTLFGSMSNQQLIDSAAQLNSLTDDKIDSIVDSVGFDKKNADYFKETLKARRDDILHRASLLENPTKDDNGQQTEQQPASTGHPETGSQPGGQVHVDSGSGGDNGSSGSTGEVAPAVAVGDKVSPDKIDSLPVGAEIALGDSSSSVKVRKTGPGNWVIAGGINNGHPLKSSSIQSHLGGESATVTYLMEDTAAPTEEPVGQQGYDVHSHQLVDLPVGSELKLNVGSGTGNGSHFKKVSDNSWEIVGGGTSGGSKVSENIVSAAVGMNGAKLIKTGTPAVQTPAVDASQVKEGDKLTLNDLKDIPDGTKLKTGNGFILEKESPTTWLFNGDGGFSLSGVSSAFGDKQMEVVHAPAGLTKESSAPTVEAPAAPTTPAVADTSGAPKVGDSVKSDHLSDLPVGTRINVGGIGVEKTSPSHWQMLNPDGSLDQHSTAYQESMLKSSWAPVEIKITYLPQVSAPQSKYKHGDVVDHADLSSMPAGSVIAFKKGGSHFTKTPAGKWESSMGGGATYTSSYMGSLYTEGELSYVSGPTWDGKINPNPQPDYVAGDSIGAQDIFQLPMGSKISYATEHYTKVDNYEWKSEATGKLYEDLDLVESLDGLDITYNGGPSNSTPTPKTTVPGKNGEAIGQGDTIIWATKGTKGQVTAVNTVDSKVQMLLPDGTKKWYASSKMVKVEAPVNQAPAAKVDTSDPSSPLYGTPEPEYTPPPKPAGLPEPASYLPAGFIEEIEKRYADKVNPTWSKAKPQDSYYWSKVEDFQNTGNVSSLETLHNKLYISDAMYQKALSHLESSSEAMKAHEDAVQKSKDAQKAYEEELNKSKAEFAKLKSEWMKANGKTTPSFDTHFPPTSTSEWSKETGFITNADGSVSADWTKAPTGSHSVSSILNAMGTDELLSAHGISAMVDSSFIKDNNVRFTKVVDEHGNVRVQARFEVSEFNKNDVISAMKAGGTSSYGVKAGFLGYIQQKLARFSIFSPTGEKLDLQSGDTYHKTVGDTKLMFQNAEGHGWTNNRGALNAMAYITMPENATAADFENALKGMGIADAHPSPKESVDFSKKKLIVSTYKGFIGEGNTKYEEDPAKLDTHVKATLASLGGGYTLDDFNLVHTDLGFYQFRVPNALRDKLTAESGVKALFHGNIDWMPESKNKYEMELPQWNESMGLERQLSRFSGATKGFLATARRMLEGDNAKGMSPDADITSGGSRYLFTTPLKKSNWQTSLGYQSGVVMPAHLAFQYLGSYANSEDNGSGKRKEGSKVAEVLAGPYGSSPELMMPNGVSVSDTWYTVTNKKQKPFLVQSLLDRGISDINGIPVEQYFVVPGVDPVPAYVEQNPAAGM